MKGGERKLSPPALRPSIAVYLLTASDRTAPAFLPALRGSQRAEIPPRLQNSAPASGGREVGSSCLCIYSEGGNRTGSVLKAGLWTLSYMKNRPPEGRAPGLSLPKEYPN